LERSIKAPVEGASYARKSIANIQQNHRQIERNVITIQRMFLYDQVLVHCLGQEIDPIAEMN